MEPNSRQPITVENFKLHNVWYLFAERVHHMHPIIFGGVITVDGFGQTSGNIDEVVQRYSRDASLSDGNVGP